MYKNKRDFITGLLTVAMMIFASTNLVQAQDMNTQNAQDQNQENVVDVIQNSDEHTIFASLLEEADKTQELRQENDVTVYAPTDEAFRDMDGELNELRQNPQELESFVDNHIENGNNTTGAYNDNQAQRDQREQGNQRDNARMQQNQNGEKEVINASNGEVHVVDKVKKDKDKKNKDKNKNNNNDYN